MKHQTPDSMKFKRLQRRLGVRKLEVVGLLELLWIATQNNAKRGDIGRYSNEDIAIECDWDGDPNELIDALADTGWLDRCDTHRLVVHNWRQHAPRYIHAWIKSQNTTFAEATTEPTTVATVEPTVVETTEATGEGGTPNLTKPNLMKERERACEAVECFDLWWERYPKKVGKGAAQKSYVSAIQEVSARGSPESSDPVAYLLDRVTEFARSDTGKSGRYCPHPATWLNQKRYYDDPKAWERTDNGATRPANTGRGGESGERCL